MKSVDRAAMRDVLLLAGAAGAADAAGYMGLGRVFTSNMTGNLVLLGIDLGQGHAGAAGRAVFSLGFFVAGLCAGGWLGRRIPDNDWPRVVVRLVGLEALLLVLFAVGWFLTRGAPQAVESYGLLAALAVAMGLQSTAMNRLNLPGVGTTAVTGTITALTMGLVELLTVAPIAAAPVTTSRSRVTFQFVVVLLYGAGAVVSGLLLLHARAWLGVGPALAVLLVALFPRASG
jgi:uncharacterized membrane protein YoaK (UPF0700 family)